MEKRSSSVKQPDPMGLRIKGCAVLSVALLFAAMLGVTGAACEETARELEAERRRETGSVSAVAARQPVCESVRLLAEAPQADQSAWTSVRCRIYHYCECGRCTGKNEGSPAYGITATGVRVCEGRTVAVDPDMIPLGSEVLINGHSYTAEDTGVHGAAVDIYVPDHEQARQMGTYETVVLWR